MQKDIHPQYHTKTVITCSCGAELETGSTEDTMQTEICSQCHPFYTGKKKVVDTTGRVDRFKKLSEKAAKAQKKHIETKSSKAKREEAKQEKEASAEKAKK